MNLKGAHFLLLLVVLVLCVSAQSENNITSTNVSEPMDERTIIVQNYFPASTPSCTCDKLKLESINSQSTTFNTFLVIVTVFLGAFAIIIAVLLGIGLYFNYKDMKEIKVDVKAELQKDLSDKAQSLIGEVMKTNYEKPISGLTDRVDIVEVYLTDIEKYLSSLKNKKSKARIPKFDDYKEDKNVVGLHDGEDENLFDKK